MSRREENSQIKEILDSGGKIYSISRLNTINTCPYQAYLQYIKGAKQKNNVWAMLGGSIHDALERCIHGADESIIKDAIQEELNMLDDLELDFPLDRNGNPSIRNNWIANMKLFAKHFKTPKGKFETEQLVLEQIGDSSWMQGYIDLIKYNDDGSIDIYDWKTSSQFDKAHLLEAGRQLIFYATIKRAEGYKIRKIAWIMLKYAMLVWTAKNGKKQTKVMEWRKVGTDLQDKMRKELVKLGYDDVNLDVYLDYLKEDNDLSRMPDEIKNNFKLYPYVREYDFTDELVSELMQYIKDNVQKFIDFGNDEKKYKPLDCDKNSFFCNNLCGYGSEKCKYYAQYLQETLIDVDEEEDLFA